MDARTDGLFLRMAALCLALAATAAPAAEPATSAQRTDMPVSATVQQPSQPKLRAIESWSTVRINDVELDDAALVYRDENGNLYTREEDLDAWALPLFLSADRITYKGQRLLLLSARPGIDLTFEENAQILDLRVNPWLRPEQRGRASARPGQQLSAGPLAFFGNYQLYATENQGSTVSGAFELGASRGRASFSSTWLGSDVAGGLRRLDSALRVDFPERRSRLVVGDSVSAAGVTGRGWRFGGVQWTTDFDLTPELPTFALPAAKGMATVPSTVDLYVNGALIGNRNVSAGPFEIPDIPVPTGAGTVMLRVRDVLGREQYYEQRFLTTPLLLPAGTAAHAVEAGSLRTDYAGESFGYRQAFLAASIRRGLRANLTIEGQLEASAAQSATRIAAATRLGDHLVAQLGTGLSRHDGSMAPMADVTLDWNAQLLSMSMQGRVLDKDFRDLASAPSGRATQEWSAQVSPRLPFAGSVGMAFTARRGSGAGSKVTVATLFASFARVAGGSLQAQVSHISSQRKQMQAGVSFVRVLGGGQSSSVNVFRDGRGTSVDAQMGQSSPRDRGWGWQLGTHQGENARYAARIEGRTAYGNGDLQLAHGGGGLGGTASWNGGWLHAAGDTYATRTLSSAIAVVETPGVPGAQVLHDGQNLGHTNRNGRLVATSLRPYEPNQLRLDASDVPVGAWIEDNSLSVAPYTRGVVYLRFATQAAASSLTLKMSDGRFVPAGARVGYDDRSYPVGDHGRVSMPLPSGRQTLRASWNDSACEIALHPDETSQELLCKPVTH